jgi:hypothetical protein
MGYGPRMQQPSNQSQFLSQTQFPSQGMNVTNMPLAPSSGQAPVSQVCLTNRIFTYFVILETFLDLSFYWEGWPQTCKTMGFFCCCFYSFLFK